MYILEGLEGSRGGGLEVSFMRALVCEVGSAMRVADAMGAWNCVARGIEHREARRRRELAIRLDAMLWFVVVLWWKRDNV